MKPKSNLILFDVTYLLERTGFTGIERVMFDTLNFFKTDQSFDVICVRFAQGRLIEVGHNDVLKAFEKLKHSQFSKTLRRIVSHIRDLLSRKFQGKQKFLLSHANVKIDKNLLKKIRNSGGPRTTYLDMGINQNYNFKTILEELQQANVQVMYYCHDVFPIKLIGDIKHSWNASFPSYLELMKLSDIVLVPSETTRIDLQEVIKDVKAKICLNPVPFQNFKNIQECQHFHIDSSNKTFVYVSTILPRKNHRLLIDEIMQNSELRLSVNFLLIGNIPRSGKWIRRALKRVNDAGGNIQILSNVSDSCLKNIYLNSHAGIYLSDAEGYGLPVYEQMNLGKKVLLSSKLRDLIRDPLGELDWFDPSVAGDLSRKILHLAKIPTQNQFTNRNSRVETEYLWERFLEKF